MTKYKSLNLNSQDIERIAQALGGVPSGEGWKIQCPSHDDENASAYLALGDGGSLIFRDHAGCAYKDGLAALRARGLLPEPSGNGAGPGRRGKAKISAKPRAKQDGKVLMPVPADAPPPPVEGLRTWKYRDAQGRPLFIVTRKDTATGKQIRPLSYWQAPDGTAAWRWKAPPEPRPLFGLDQLDARPDAAVLLVEGEKAAEAARELAPGAVAVTWPGGSAAVGKIDWSPLHGRRVALWPDRDAPGEKAVNAVAALLHRKAAALKLIDSPEGPADGWDLADALAEGWTPEQMRNWIKANSRDWEPEAEAASDWADGLIYDSKGQTPRALVANALHALRHAPELHGLLGINMLTQRPQLMRPAPWGGKAGDAWGSADDVLLAEWMQHHGICIGSDQAGSAAQTIAKDVQIDPVRDYLLSLQWDGQPRLDNWARTYLGTPPLVHAPTLRDALARLFLLSAVARALQPGCQVDHVLVLEGPQGRLKSSALKTLFDPWFIDSLPNLGDKDSQLAVAGAWGIELAELEALGRSEVEKIKAFISRRIDSFRPPYGRRMIDAPRRCVFAGTTNSAEYLKDSTGNRRFWPIPVGQIDLAALKRDRDQLWGEAVHRFHLGEAWWPTDDSLVQDAAEEQEARRQSDPWESLIADYVSRRVAVTTAELLETCLKVDTPHQNRAHAMRVGQILQTLGFARKRERGADGNLRWVYHRGGASGGGAGEHHQPRADA